MISTDFERKVAPLSSSHNLTLTPIGLVVKANSLTDFQLQKEGLTEFGLAFKFALSSLLEQGIAVEVASGVLIEHGDVDKLYDPELGFSSWLPRASPYILEVTSRGSFGDSQLFLVPSFLFGKKKDTPQRVGAFLVRGSNIYYLSSEQFELLEKIDSFNRLPEERKTKREALLCFASMNKHIAESDVQLDRYLASTMVVAPSTLKLDLEHHKNGDVSLAPIMDGDEQSQFREAFLELNDVDEHYEFQDENGLITRVVLNDNLVSALKVMKKNNFLRGARKNAVLANPRTAFVELSEMDCISFDDFGPRVKGIGPYVYEPKPYIKGFDSGFLKGEEVKELNVSASGDYSAEVGITTVDGDGLEVKIPITSPQQLNSIIESVKLASEKREDFVTLADSEGIDRTVPLTDHLKNGLDELKQYSPSEKKDRQSRESERHSEKVMRSAGNYVLIFENIDSLEYSEQADRVSESLENYLLKYEQPRALTAKLETLGFDLKQHQKEGISWLQDGFSRALSTSLNQKRRGCLLADDMGLGKTLQILSFIAWCVESGHKSELGKLEAPYQPVLIVCPVILLDNWAQEIRKFFENNGYIFEPLTILHGNSLKKLKVENPGGKEFQHGVTTLDLEQLKSNRLVITNYDTVKNYQHSFAKIRWSAVIADEAQEIKEPNSSVTWAMKSLNSLFRVAMTGTPVENRLSDLWNILDFAQPGLLGSQKEFSKNYEQLADESERAIASKNLRKAINFDTPATYILRRTKQEHLQGLPKKIEQHRYSKLNAQQINLHREILTEARKSKKFLPAVQQLSKLYQHPDLLMNSSMRLSAKTLAQNSTKLMDLLVLLREIKSRGEKVLIFAFYRDMQYILKKVMDEEFGLEIDIINGCTSNKRTDTNDNLRLALIKRFESKIGFNILILSPDVAGVGLTITGANNVIHYGRWWNPAKEMQATDRAYRIGQTKDVNVYYLISKSDEFKTFDEKLDELLSQKKQLSSDFLRASAGLEISDAEKMSMLDGDVQIEKGRTSEVFTFEQIQTLDGLMFEAFVAALFSAEGAKKVILTPLGNDGGADIVVQREDYLELIQCKHSQGKSLLNNDAIQELLSAESIYKNQFFPSAMKKLPVKLTCVTNFKADSSFYRDAEKQSVGIIDEKILRTRLSKLKINQADILRASSSRLRKMSELVYALKN